VSLQFSILKVLAGQPNGRANVPNLNRYITLLSVPEWTARMKRLSSLVPDLDIFGSRYVLRDEAGWQLTDAGHAFLITIEQTASGTLDQELTPIEVIVIPSTARRASTPLLRLVADNQAGRRLTLKRLHQQGPGRLAS
jgi:hypothetical protein